MSVELDEIDEELRAQVPPGPWATWVPALLAEARRLRAVVEKEKAWREAAEADCDAAHSAGWNNALEAVVQAVDGMEDKPGQGLNPQEVLACIRGLTARRP